VITDHLALHKD